MKVNSEKTKVVLFNKSTKYDFMPKIHVNPNENVEVVDKIKLLGVIISSDMKWHKHVSYICKKGYANLWALRRLKKLGASSDILLDLYQKQVRSVMEYAVPVWGTNLTEEDNVELERVQKVALAIIFGHKSYENILSKYKIESLHDRRITLIRKFAKKTSKSTIFSSWFNKKTQVKNTRNRLKYFEVPARTDRWKKSPIPHMKKLLNSL